MIDLNYLIRCAKDSDSGEAKGLTWEKEVIYEGSFVAPQADGSKQRFSVTEKDLHHWKKSIDEQRERGIKVDTPIGHTNDPLKSVGEIIASRVDKDSQGRWGLFLTFSFADPKYARLAKTAEVSIFSPPSWDDGLGNTYRRPIRHVAFTQEPVIPALDKFTLVASLEGEQPTMLRELAAELGIEVADDDTDETLYQKIVDAFNAGSGDEEEVGDPSEDPPEEIEMSDDEELPAEDDEEDVPADAMSLSLLRENRSMKIDKLVTERKITPAQAKHLKTKYTEKGSLSLSLKSGSDNFDDVYTTLNLGAPVITKSNSGAQRLPRNSENVLISNAESRKKG
jgi:hypothetical protein